MNRIVWVATVALCISAVGCGQGTAHVGGPSVVHSESLPSSPASDREEYLEEVAERNHLEDPPEVAIIREISPDERDAAYASCMTAAGFPPKEGSLGQWDVPPLQDKAFNVALFTCEASYPLAAKYRQPMNREQIRLVYAYYGHELAACIQARGFSSPDLPSFEQFVASAGTAGEFNPWALIPVENLEVVWKECEQLPPDEVLYP